MKSRKLKWNRRREPRQHCDYKSVAWSKEGKKSVNRGWLNDQSWSGLSFYVPSCTRPTVGDEIELMTRPHGDKTCCRVVRLAETEDERTLIGCQKDVPGAVVTPREPKRRIIENVRVPKGQYRKQNFSKVR
jgi:hypothetical protein